MARQSRSLFSLSTVFASFFGAAMVASAFAYFNYKFSEYKFIDFHEWIFYESHDLFGPTQERYVVVFYSSNRPGMVETLQKVHAPYPVIAIDYYQDANDSSENIRFLKAGTNTTLKFVQRFNIYHVPSVFIIKRVKESLYKQDSMIRQFDTLDKLNFKDL